MDIFFIGVGDACDPQHGNTSIHIQTTNGVSILCDCGFTVPHNYFAFTEDPNQLDIVWLSHFHGDHFFGLPLVILRFKEMERTKPLLILGQKGVEEKVLTTMDLAFPGFRSKIGYELQFKEVEPGSTSQVLGLTCRVVETDHSQLNLGFLVDDGQKKLYYSGDGRPTAAVTDLTRNCDIAVHEAFRLEEEAFHHGSIKGCLQLAETSNIKKMALVHLDRKFRKEDFATIRSIVDSNPSVFLPESGTELII